MAALQSKHSGRIRMTLKPNTPSVAQQVVIRLVTDPKFAVLFNTKSKQYKNDQNAAKMHEWLLQEGYDTTLDDILQAKAELQKSSLLMWSGQYSSSIANVNIIDPGGSTTIAWQGMGERGLCPEVYFC